MLLDVQSHRRRRWRCVALLCGSICCPLRAAELFGPSGVSVAVGNTPSDVAIADFDDDGLLDLAVANERGHTVSVLLGDGLGGFTSTPEAPVGRGPRSIASGDFDGDGIVDLATAGFVERSISVLLGDGLGGFARAADVPLSEFPSSLAVGDFDANGVQDLAVTFSVTTGGDGSSVGIFTGDGGGGFDHVADLDVGPAPHDVVIADLDLDGALDLAVANRGIDVVGDTVSILLGDGHAGFARQPDVQVGQRPQALSIADLDGDARPDLAVVNESSSSVTVLLGDGAGGFRREAVLEVGFRPQSIVATDLDADGVTDLVVTSEVDAVISVLLGNGRGGFVRSDTDTTGPTAIAAGDLDNNGAVDLVLTNGRDRSVSVLLGDGLGGFSRATSTAVGGFPRSVALADFNRDGATDVAAARSMSSAATLLLGDGRGDFSSTREVPLSGSAVALATADFNGDGLPDLAVDAVRGAQSDDAVTLLLGDGQGGFAASGDVVIGPGQSPDLYLGDSKLALLDYDSDGATDLAVVRLGAVSLLAGDGQGGLRVAGDLTLSFDPPAPRVTTAVVAADFDGNGFADLAVASYFLFTFQDVSILLGDGRGGFVQSQDIEVGARPATLATLDANDDGVVDLAVANYAGRSVSLLLGDGSGGFVRTAQDLTVADRPRSFAVADHNGDGLPDLAVAHGSGSVGVFVGDGAGGFSAAANLELGSDLYSARVADLDSDGAADLVVADAVGGTVEAVFNQLEERADINGSNRIDGFDLAAIGRFVGAQATDPGYRRGSDVDLNGTIDGDDLARAAARFGELNRSVSPLRAGIPAPIPPDPHTVTLQSLPGDGDLFRVQVLVNDDASPAAAADFAVLFGPDDGNPAQVLEVVGFEPGRYLSGGAGQLYSKFDTGTPGRVGVSVARLPAEDRIGSGLQPLLSLLFRPRRVGTARLDFAPFVTAAPTLINAAGGAVAGVSFVGGARVEVDASGGGPPGQKIGFSPALLDFGEPASGSSARRRLRISNFGFSDLEIHGADATLSEFTSLFGSAFTIPPFGFVELGVSFSPVEAGHFSGDLVIASSDPEQPELLVPLLGRSDLEVAVTPARLDFGPQAIGSSRSLRVSVTHHGVSDFALTGVTSSHAAFAPLAHFSSLAPGESGEIEVRFRPTSTARLHASLTLHGVGPDAQRIVVALSGRGEPTEDGVVEPAPH